MIIKFWVHNCTIYKLVSSIVCKRKVLVTFYNNLFQGVQEEVRKVNKVDGHRSNLSDKNSYDIKQSLGVDTTSSGVVIVSGVAKKKDNNTRGELIEQNQDALEV